MPPVLLDALRDKTQHVLARIKMRDTGASRVGPALLQLAQGAYHRYGYGWPSFLQDLIL